MEIRVGNRIAEVELISKVGNCVRMSIDGKVLDLDVMMAENGVCSILMDGVSYNAELIRAEGGKSYTVNTAFASLPVEILDAKAKLLSARRKEGERQEDRIVALMPGKVVRVMVAEGDRLAAGDTVLVPTIPILVCGKPYSNPHTKPKQGASPRTRNLLS